jgi:hypothetical protein
MSEMILEKNTETRKRGDCALRGRMAAFFERYVSFYGKIAARSGYRFPMFL